MSGSNELWCDGCKCSDTAMNQEEKEVETDSNASDECQCATPQNGPTQRFDSKERNRLCRNASAKRECHISVPAAKGPAVQVRQQEKDEEGAAQKSSVLLDFRCCNV